MARLALDFTSKILDFFLLLLVVLFWEAWILALVFLSSSFSFSQTLYILSLRYVYPWHSLSENFLHCWDHVPLQPDGNPCLSCSPVYLQHLAVHPVYRLHPIHVSWMKEWICLFICFYGKVMMWKHHYESQRILWSWSTTQCLPKHALNIWWKQ